ncbi:MAG: hypothetical protein KJ597_00055 [Nanoarchaeota archaeon]|nr:hypothetical protein [Nanoarchaeota archaeon]MBU1621946.1 hypothetical protein [Nanoarchaeota archaeon]
MRENHLEQVERWANFVKNNPTEWKKVHSEFINAIFDNHYMFRARLLKTPHGKKKFIELYKIKNLKGYDFLK